MRIKRWALLLAAGAVLLSAAGGITWWRAQSGLDALGRTTLAKSSLKKIRVSGFFPHDPSSENWALAQSPQIGLLLARARYDRRAVAHEMSATLRQVLADWPMIRAAEADAYRQGLYSNGVSRASSYEIAYKRAINATYVLAEMQYHDGLRLLYESCRTQQAWVDAVPEGRFGIFFVHCPVPPPISLYALHRLISTYPTAHLAAAPNAAHSAYMRWAGEHVPEPEDNPVVYRQADLLEAREGAAAAAALRGVPLLPEYPSNFRGGMAMQKYPVAPYMTERSKEWFVLMRAFVESLPEQAPQTVSDQLPAPPPPPRYSEFRILDSELRIFQFLSN